MILPSIGFPNPFTSYHHLRKVLLITLWNGLLRIHALMALICKIVNQILMTALPLGLQNSFIGILKRISIKHKRLFTIPYKKQINIIMISWKYQPYLCFLDIGCGAGAATFALLDLISAYHDFRIANGHTLYELSISIAVIDPCAFALKTLQQVAKYLEPELARKGIHLTIFEVIDEFPLPGCISKIIDGWNPIYPFTLLAISSNVIRPLQNLFDKVRSLRKAVGMTQEFELGNVVANAYDQIITNFGFEQVIIQDIATRDKIRNGLNLFDAFQGLWRIVSQALNQKSVLFGGPVRKRNPLFFTIIRILFMEVKIMNKKWRQFSCLNYIQL